jgi:hypothetical protein
MASRIRILTIYQRFKIISEKSSTFLIVFNGCMGGYLFENQCCGSGSGIRCLFDPWIRDPE